MFFIVREIVKENRRGNTAGQENSANTWNSDQVTAAIVAERVFKVFTYDISWKFAFIPGNSVPRTS